GPEDPYEGLLGTTASRGDHPVTSEPLHLIEGGSIGGARERGRRGDAELVCHCEHDRTHLMPAGTQGERELADGIRAPCTRSIARGEVNTHIGFEMLRTIVGAQGEDGSSSPVAERDPLVLRTSVAERGEVVDELLVKVRRL